MVILRHYTVFVVLFILALRLQTLFRLQRRARYCSGHYHRFRRGFDDIGRQTHAVKTTAVIIDHDIHLTRYIFAAAFGRRVIFDQLPSYSEVTRLIAQ